MLIEAGITLLCPRDECKHDVGSHSDAESTGTFPLTIAEIVEFLDAANLSTVEEERESERGWLLAVPLEKNTFQEVEEHIKKGQAAIAKLKENLDSSDVSAQPLIFAFIGCAGVGKSRCCDESQKIFFPTQDSVLIKVAYNVVQFSQMETEHPLSGFFLRIIAGIYGAVNPKFTVAHVPSFLSRVTKSGRWSVEWDFVVEFAQKMLPPNLPWILAVDELVKLPVTKETRELILHHCSQWVKLSIGSSHLRCVVMTSFVPKLLSNSGRAPICISPSLFHAKSSIAMARDFGLDPENPLVIGAILMAGGHPRALCRGLKFIKEHGAIMPVSLLAEKLRAAGIALETIPLLIRHSFKAVQLCDLPEKLRDLAKHGSVRFAAESRGIMGWISIPLPLIAAAIDRAHPLDRKKAPYSEIWELMQPTCQDTKKQLEECIHRFDLIKNACGLQVVPPELKVISPHDDHNRGTRGPKAPRIDDAKNWHELQYDFTEYRSDVNVLQRRVGDLVEFKEEFRDDLLHRRLYVYCPDPCHPFFETMYDAKFPDGAPVKVLLQVKINTDLEKAILGLCTAADLLVKAGWTGAFLFVVVLGEDAPLPEECKHPLLVVQKSDYDSFFTPTFSPIVEMQRFRDQARADQNERSLPLTAFERDT